MRLLFVIDSFASGGAQRQMIKLAVGLKLRGHQVEFFIYYPQHTHFRFEVEQAGIAIHEHQKTSRFSTAIIQALSQQIRRVRYDGILSFLTTPNFYTEITRIQNRRLFLVVSERNIFHGQSLIRSWFLRQMHRLSTHVTVNSYYQQQQLSNKAPWLNAKITTIYNGVDLEEFTPSLEKHTHQRVRLLAVGSIVSKKNPIGLAKALIELKKQNRELPEISWAGEVYNNLESQREFESVNTLLKENDLLDKWKWLGNRDDIPVLLPQYDALIHPSFYEGLPNAVCEAMACGLPILLSNICEHPRLVADGVNGFLFDPNDSTNMAEVVHEFVKLDKNLREGMAKQSRKFAQTNFSIDEYVQKYESLFYSLIP